MPGARFNVSVAADSANPRDYLMNVLHFNVLDPSPDWDELCQDLADIYTTQWIAGAARQVEVKSYDIGPPPQYPTGTAVNNVAAAPASLLPREVALCLSFYHEHNTPRARGRLYLPIGVRSATAAARPAAGLLTSAMDMGLAFCNLGGVDVDWSIWSPTDQELKKVTHYWCDDEWDTMRSRGMRSTTRQTATTDE